MYLEQVDEFGKTYFTWEVGPPFNAPIKGDNIVSFLSEDLKVQKWVENIFLEDLTRSRDEVLLAVLSLLLLLVIQGIVTTILLRTRDGQVSTFSFAVKQVVELAREFRLKRIWEGPRGTHGGREGTRSRIDLRLVIIAVIVVLGTFGLEVLVLFLTNLESRAVSNRSVALELVYPWNPDWNAVRFHNRASINRPCMAVSLIDVDQGSTRISSCMTSTFGTDAFGVFKKAEKEQRVTIITDVHEFGMEHQVQIGEEKEANYSGRAYFILGDEKPRIMARRSPNTFVKTKVDILHKQYLAYLFSIYKREVEDEDMNLARLTEIEPQIKFREVEGVDVPIIFKITGNEKEIVRNSHSNRYISSFEGIVPAGKAALRFAQPVFKAAMAVKVGSGNMTDLLMDEGVKESFGVVWQEPIRVINWLSLTIVLVSALVILALLRFILKPVATAEIAGLFVKEAVGATWDRPPLRMEDSEKKSFRPNYTQGAALLHPPGQESSAAFSMSGDTVPMQYVASTADELNVQDTGEVFGFRGTNDDYIFRSTGISYGRQKMEEDYVKESSGSR